MLNFCSIVPVELAVLLVTALTATGLMFGVAVLRIVYHIVVGVAQ